MLRYKIYFKFVSTHSSSETQPDLPHEGLRSLKQNKRERKGEKMERWPPSGTLSDATRCSAIHLHPSFLLVLPYTCCEEHNIFKNAISLSLVSPSLFLCVSRPPKWGCCNPLRFSLLNAIYSFIYNQCSFGFRLFIETKISTNYLRMTSLWRHNVSMPMKIWRYSERV